ncbi:hypothetical protein LTR95_004382 [Oleoguttula sp. CCFEE 5521]
MAPLKSAVRVLLVAATIGLVAVNAHTLCAKNCYAEIASDNGCVGRDPNSTRINLDCFCKLPMTVVIPQCEAACRPSGNWHENDNDICGPLQPVGGIAIRDVEVSHANAVVDTRDARKVFKADKKVCDQRCYHSLKRAKECDGHICTINDLTINRDVSDGTERTTREVAVDTRDADAAADPKLPPLTLCGWTGISCAVAANGDSDVVESAYDDTEEVPLLPVSTATVDKRNAPAETTDAAVEHDDSGILDLNDFSASIEPIDILPRSLPPPTLCGYHGMSCASVVNRDVKAPVPTTFETVYTSDVQNMLPRSIRPPTLCGFFGISCAKVDDRDVKAPVPTTLDTTSKTHATTSVGPAEKHALQTIMPSGTDLKPIDVFPRSIRPPTLCGFFGISCHNVVDSDVELPVPTALDATFQTVDEKDVPFVPIITAAPGSTASRVFTLQGPPPLVTSSPITTVY